MRVNDLKLRLRGATRTALSAVLRTVPAAWFEPLRRPSTRGFENAASERLRTGLLEVARHRGIPAQISQFSLVDRPELAFVNADSMILQRLYWFGERGYEPGLVKWWRYFCRRSASILELGANVGYYTVQGAHAAGGSTYVAVEPHPEAVRVCEANIALNCITNVRLIKAAAVADPAGTSLPLTIPRRDHFGVPTGSFLPGPTEIASRGMGLQLRHISVPAVPFTQLVRGVDLLKLDVEGQEHELLEAGMEQLRSQLPTIFLEILRNTPRLRALVAGLCRTAEYSCYVPTTEALVQLAPEAIHTVDLKKEYGTRDVILTRVAGLTAEA